MLEKIYPVFEMTLSLKGKGKFEIYWRTNCFAFIALHILYHLMSGEKYALLKKKSSSAGLSANAVPG